MKKLLFTLFICFNVIVGFGQTVGEKLHEYLQAMNKVEGFNGVVLVAQNGNILLEKGYGYRNAEAGIMHDANSIFQIGSVTKQFTSAIILKLQQQRKLNVKDKLSKYFPAYTFADKITIKNLLNHTSGIYNYTNEEDFMKNHTTEPLSQDGFWNLIKDKPLDFEPGTQYKYSNSGYSILGYIIEKITKKPYTVLATNWLFKPSSMTHSGFNFSHLMSPNKTVGYLLLNKATQVKASIVDSTVSYSAGAIYSTVHDLYNWNSALNSGKILPLPVLEKAYQPFKGNYGYGFFIDSIQGKRKISHGGRIPGFISQLTYIPEDKTTVVILSNAPLILSSFESNILSILYNQPYKVPQESKEIKLDSNKLKEYVGVYELAPNFKITIELVNGALKTQATNQPQVDLFPESENLFFLKVVKAQVEFVRNDKGEVESMILHQNGQHVPGKKIK